MKKSSQFLRSGSVFIFAAVMLLSCNSGPMMVGAQEDPGKADEETEESLGLKKEKIYEDPYLLGLLCSTGGTGALRLPLKESKLQKMLESPKMLEGYRSEVQILRAAKDDNSDLLNECNKTSVSLKVQNDNLAWANTSCHDKLDALKQASEGTRDKIENLTRANNNLNKTVESLANSSRQCFTDLESLNSSYNEIRILGQTNQICRNYNCNYTGNLTSDVPACGGNWAARFQPNVMPGEALLIGALFSVGGYFLGTRWTAKKLQAEHEGKIKVTIDELKEEHEGAIKELKAEHKGKIKVTIDELQAEHKGKIKVTIDELKAEYEGAINDREKELKAEYEGAIKELRFKVSSLELHTTSQERMIDDLNKCIREFIRELATQRSTPATSRTSSSSGS